MLAVVGARDRMLDTRATAKRLRSLVATATVTVLPEAGHLIAGYTIPVREFLTAESRE
jgi:hypothetical protein